METQAIIPVPRVAAKVRPATLDDFAFIDRLQTAYCKQLGYMFKAQLQSKLESGHVLVAEHDGAPVGYVIGTDRYFKRDDCGIIFQLCVEEGARRGLIGAMLVKAMFDRAAYGCRLFCCWCAQDIEANRFWESLGFVPLAFRAGSEKKRKGGRVHIFWQKRIRPGDVSTPWWFPAKTDSGSMREDRIALPIPPGMHWSDELPVLSPEAQSAPDREREPSKSAKAEAPPEKPARRPRPHVQFGFPTASPQPAHVETVTPGQKKPRREKRKADPRIIAAARELRDRWLEKVDEDPSLLLPQGKYDVARELRDPADQRHAVPRLGVVEVKALPEAA